MASPLLRYRLPLFSHKAHVKPRKSCAKPCAITHKPRKTARRAAHTQNFFLPHLQHLTKSIYHSVSLFITLRKCQKRIAYLCVVKRWQRGLSPASLRRGACRHRANCSTPIQRRDENEAVRWCHPEWKEIPQRERENLFQFLIFNFQFVWSTTKS